ncbi:iron ABC transporter permease [Methylocapsa polymorpha]|uniref:Iron ABC transporter permease n=1 Tax=Methylocapsa polymorpha TaxID=3080828 RepID=A0ABZ0HWG6_9HYPH|nr:iron ABC transporter permease [Methylocapsa sp. RX1]
MQKRLTLTAAAILLAVIGLLPLIVMVADTFFVNGGFSAKAYDALLTTSKHQAAPMAHSMLLSFLTSALAAFVGAALGLLLGKTDLPWRHVLMALFTVPLLLPPYVIATAWFTILGKGGLIGHALPSETTEFLSSALFGLFGCTGVLFTAFMPIVMLLTIAHAGAVNPRWEDAARLVSGWPSILRRITLPSIAPGIAFAAVLVFLLTFGETGVPTFLRYPVYPVEALTQFAAFYDFRTATASTIPMLVVTSIILILEYGLERGKVSQLRAEAPGERRAKIELKRWRLPIFVIVSVWAFVSVLLPLLALVIQSSSVGAYVEAFSRASDSIMHSLAFAVIGATLLTLLGFFCGVLIHDPTQPLARSVDGLALFLFTLPGTVIGIGLIGLWNRPMTNVIYATPAIIILGYLAQYSVLPMRVTSATLARIPRSLEEAARLSGASWFMTLTRIVAPLATRGLMAAWLISYVFCLRDLGISMVVYPAGYETLPVRILTLMANGAPNLIAALCVILIAATLLPLGVAGLWLKYRARHS